MNASTSPDPDESDLLVEDDRADAGDRRPTEDVRPGEGLLSADRRRMYRRRRIAVGAAALVVVAAIGGGAWGIAAIAAPGQVPTIASTVFPDEAAPSAPPTFSLEPAAPTESTTPAARPGVGDIADPNGVSVLVNKRHALIPVDYAPNDLVAMSDIGVPSANGHSLRAPAANAMRAMRDAALAEAGISLDMTSGYRGYDLQTELYNSYVSGMGQAPADATSARPGFSEHQTGLAADISATDEPCALQACFADQPAGQWLAANAWRFGFILRYPAGRTATTGYEFEPWHYRFVGEEAARGMHDAGIQTWEEYVGSEDAPDYAQ